MKGFISYAHADYDAFKAFCKAVAPAARYLGVEFWSDPMLHTGQDWNQTIADAVAAALADLDAELEQLREVLPLANDPSLRPALDQLDIFVRTAESVLQTRGDAIEQRLVDALADLLGTLRLVRLPSRDPEFGFTLGLREVRGAQGQIVLTLTNTLAAAVLGLRPSQPDATDALAAELPRSLFDYKLTGIAAQLDAVADRLEALDAARQSTDATSPEARLVEFYLGTMRVEVNLARLSLTLGERTIDFAALARATGAMAELTGDFLATLRGWAKRVSALVRRAAERVAVPIRLMVTGLRAAAREAAARVAPGTDATIPEALPPDPAHADAAVPVGFSAEAVRDLILSGKSVPADWVPLVTDLDSSGMNLADLSHLASFLENRTFDEITIGESASLHRTLTQSDIELFANVSGDVNPSHLDADYAGASLFHGIVAHEMLGGSLFSAVLGTLLPGPGTIYLGQDLQFRRPVKPGDTLSVKVTVRSKDAKTKRVVLDCLCSNQNGETVITGAAEVVAPMEKIRRERMPLPEVPG
jgi:acyl dehydratase